MECKCISIRPISCEDVHIDKMPGLSVCIPLDGERNGSVHERSLSEEPDGDSKGLTKRGGPRENVRLEGEVNKKEEILSNVEDQEEIQVPDGGWGWVVVFGAALILVLVDSMGPCFGIVFSARLIELEASSTMTAWIFNMFEFLWCITGPPLGPLTEEFGWRKVTFVGSIMLTVATITSSFVTSAWILFFTYSVLGGIACGLLANVSYVIVPYYFNKRRGLANGIVMAFDCGGQLFGPPLIYALQTEYGFAGALLIMGGIIFHCCIGAMVFHPVEWHMKPQDCHIENIKNIQQRQSENDEHLKESSTSGCHWKLLVNLIRSTLANLSILRSARAIIIALGATFILNGYLNFLVFVPFAMNESGFSSEEAAWCVSISAMCNMLTRIIVSTLTDTRWFNFQHCYLFSTFTIVASMCTFMVMRDHRWLLIVMAFWGCGVGAFMSTFNLVMVHYMGLDKFMPMMGATLLCIATGNLTIGPSVGYIHTVTGNYTIAMTVLAVIVFCSFVLWLFMPAAVAFDKRRKAKQENAKAP